MRDHPQNEGPGDAANVHPARNQETLRTPRIPRDTRQGTRVLHRRRNPFPFGNLRRLQTNGQLGTWLDISTAKLRSVTGEASS